MAHLVFIVIHLVCVFAMPLVLVVTIPLHLIYAVVSGRAPAAGPSPDTHVRCPDCRELVLKDARVCKHCGCRLVPESEQEAQTRKLAEALERRQQR
jgi:hypothetical protein